METTKPRLRVRGLLCASPNTVTPKLQSLLLADHVYQDRQTGKRVVAGIFNRLLFTREILTREVEKDGKQQFLVPAGVHSGSPYAYLSLTDVVGTVNFQLRYVDLKDDSVLMKLDFSVNCTDRLATVELTVPLPPLPRPHSGVFALELLAGDEPLGSLRIIVEEMTPPSPEQKELPPNE